MRSSREWVVAASLALALGACGNDSSADLPPDAAPDVDAPDTSCDESYLGYRNFAAPFVNDWCRGCHGADAPAAMRQNAPLGVDFDDLASLRQWSERIRIRATGPTPTMPPAGGPSAHERELLVEWLRCGAKE